MDRRRAAPRKSHKKSRKGCRTCVQRHIRCDETRPSCHNCTYRNLPCHYTDESLHLTPGPILGPPILSQRSLLQPTSSRPTTFGRQEQGLAYHQVVPFSDTPFANHGVSSDTGTNHVPFSQLHHHSAGSELAGSGTKRGPEIGALDPFNALSITASPHIHFLLNHYDKVVRHSRGIPGPREKWLSFAVSDSAVLPMILFICALDIAGLRGKNDSPDIIFWKGKTIQAINARLADPKEMVTDGTIAAVASLAHLENLAGTVESARIHATGLEALVKTRGGLQTLGEHSMTRRIVSWSDICTSIILETKPRYDPIFTQGEMSATYQSPPSALAHPYKTKMIELTRMLDLSEEVIILQEEMRTLSYLKEKAAYILIEGEEIDNVPFTDTAEHIERRLVPLTQLKFLPNQTTDCSLFVIFAYAALIHLYLFIRDCSKDLPFSRLLSRRLRSALESVNTEVLESQFPEMMLWILIMGGLSGNPLLERVWFAKRTADFCCKLELSGGDEIKHRLEDFLWSELYRSPITGKFWTEVAKQQGSVMGYEVRRMADCVSLVYFNAPVEVDD